MSVVRQGGAGAAVMKEESVWERGGRTEGNNQDSCWQPAAGPRGATISLPACVLPSAPQRHTLLPVTFHFLYYDKYEYKTRLQKVNCPTQGSS